MSEHFAGNIDLCEVLKTRQQRLAMKNRHKRNTLILLIASAFVLFVIYKLVDVDPNLYLPSDNLGRVKSISSFNSPLLPYEDRLALATRIVQTMNSLSYRDKDDSLSQIERYFSPGVFKSYIVSQYNNGFFKQMTQFGVSYIAKLSPGYVHKGEAVPVIYAEDICYEPDIMGDSIKAQVDCRHTAPVNRYSETFFFNIRRFVVVKGVMTRVQEFKVRLVLTRVDGAVYSKGYLVSEYTEI